MKVLHVGKYYPPVPGGMERVLQLLCEGERLLVDSRVLVAGTLRGTQREVRNGVPVTRSGSLARIGSVGLAPGLPLELFRSDRDITVVHEPNPVALASDFLTGGHGPLVVYFHSEVVRAEWKYRLLYRPFLRRVLDRAARIIVASPSMARSAEQLEAHRHKCVVIPYGIDPAPLAATPAVRTRAAALRQELGAPLVLFAGRLVPYKGVDVLLRAMATVDARLVVVGDGPLRRTLEAQASGACSGRVTFAGTVADEELTALYHACDVFVLPSVTRAEAFGMVQIEAMACGKPVVSTSVPSGVPWVNQHQETGLIVEPGDANALAGAVRTLLADSALRARFGQAGQRRVAQEFTASRMAERTVALYRDVLDSIGRGPQIGPTDKSAPGVWIEPDVTLGRQPLVDDKAVALNGLDT
jgi:rhamnosyl/mannosyltransferase